MNIANGTAKVEQPAPARLDLQLPLRDAARRGGDELRTCTGVIGENETGFRGTDDVPLPHRGLGRSCSPAAGSTTTSTTRSRPAHPDGTFLDYSSPGGGSPAFRKQMRVLKDFVALVRLRADAARTRSVVEAPAGLAVQALVETGRQYAVYLHAPVGAGRLRGPLDGPPGPARDRPLSADDRLGRRRAAVARRKAPRSRTGPTTPPTEDHATVELVAGRPGRPEGRVLPGRRRARPPG